ncbi:MAG: aminoacyl-tRNA hydrolase [Vigna little leaf phytoplasma]|nr:aminoacyl-tRNA hydrolase [Vigna little leaf phytoplasma]
MIVGLGNPGSQFESTPHNIGFMMIDYFLQKFNSCLLFRNKQFNSLVYILQMNEEKCILVKPQTYMNLSGVTIKKLIHYYNLNIIDILIIVDDIHLKVGCFKLKQKSGHGGHNGLKNIIESLGTKNIKRLKIGVGYNENIKIKEYVLTPFTESIKKNIFENFPLFSNVLINFIKSFPFENLSNSVK